MLIATNYAASERKWRGQEKEGHETREGAEKVDYFPCTDIHRPQTLLAPPPCSHNVLPRRLRAN